MSENGSSVAANPLDPAQFAWTPPPLLDEDAGTGLAREKHPVATLRVFTGPDEAEWLLYGGVQGGSQGAGWIALYYRGIIQQGAAHVFGDWLLRVEGTGLESLAHQLAKQVRTVLRVGTEENYEIRRIALEPLKLVEQGE